MGMFDQQMPGGAAMAPPMPAGAPQGGGGMPAIDPNILRSLLQRLGIGGGSGFTPNMAPGTLPVRAAGGAMSPGMPPGAPPGMPPGQPMPNPAAAAGTAPSPFMQQAGQISDTDRLLKMLERFLPPEGLTSGLDGGGMVGRRGDAMSIRRPVPLLGNRG